MTFQGVIGVTIALLFGNLLISGVCFQNPAYRLTRQIPYVFSDFSFRRQFLTIPSMERSGGLIFISCGQLAKEERGLGEAVCELVRNLTPSASPYFAQNESSLDGVTKNIPDNLDDAVALIAIMHYRGDVCERNGNGTTATVLSADGD